jgi:hypothetical protein
MIYAIFNGTHVKFGYTKDRSTIENRIRSLNVGSSNRLELLALSEGKRREEKRIHDVLFQHRANGEWFIKNHEVDYMVGLLLECNASLAVELFTGKFKKYEYRERLAVHDEEKIILAKTENYIGALEVKAAAFRRFKELLKTTSNHVELMGAAELLGISVRYAEHEIFMHLLLKYSTACFVSSGEETEATKRNKSDVLSFVHYTLDRIQAKGRNPKPKRLAA